MKVVERMGMVVTHCKVTQGSWETGTVTQLSCCTVTLQRCYCRGMVDCKRVMADCCKGLVDWSKKNHMGLELVRTHQMLPSSAVLVVAFSASIQQRLASCQDIGRNPMIRIRRLSRWCRGMSSRSRCLGPFVRVTVAPSKQGIPSVLNQQY